MYRGRGNKNTTPPLGTVRGLGCRTRPAGGGGSGVMNEGGIHREEGNPVQDNHGAERPGCGSRTEMGGQLDEGRQAQARARNSFGTLTPVWEGSADERWRLSGGEMVAP